MPESRDRLIREGPVTPILPRRSVHGGGIWIDTEQETGSGNGGRDLFGTPMQLGLARRSSIMGSRGSPRTGYGGSPWRLYGNRSVGQENRSSLGGRRGGSVRRVRNNVASSVLPSWYPRRSLQDITAVVDAVERRRSRLRGVEDHRLASPLQRQLQTPVQQQELRTPIPGAPLEHKFSLTSPKPTATSKNFYLPHHMMPKILLGNQAEGETDFVTPQKKLLNSIDQVEKVMKEEFRRMKRTPTAKRAERDTKVRTLMTMR